MEKYTNYCTEEQTLKALKLGAQLESGIEDVNPFDKHRPFIHMEQEPNAFSLNNSSCWFRPTTQQMIGWLREKKFLITLHGMNPSLVGSRVVYFGESKYNLPLIISKIEMSNPQKVELAAIDTALDYLEKRNESN